MDNETAAILRSLLNKARTACRPATLNGITDDAFLEYAGRAQEHAQRGIDNAGFIGVHVEIYQRNLRALDVELVAEVHGCPSISVSL